MASIKDTFTIIVDVQAAVDRVEEFIQLIEHDAKASLEQEPGCLRFDVLRDPKDDTKFTFYEVYVSAEAFAHHQTTEHFAMWSKFKESGGASILGFRQLKSLHFIK